MSLSKPVITNNLKPYKQVGPLTAEQQAFVGAMRRIRKRKGIIPRLSGRSITSWHGSSPRWKHGTSWSQLMTF